MAFELIRDGIIRPFILFVAFVTLASCAIVDRRPSADSIAAANRIAADISAHRAAAAFGTELSSPALATFARVYDRVRQDYVRRVDDTVLLTAARDGMREKYPEPKGVDDGKLVMAAIDGMLSSLDRYSSYLNPADLKAMRERIRGEFGGLGIKVRKHEKGLLVVAPIDGTPAARAGLKSEDLITHADGEPLHALSLGPAVRLLRGKVGDPIRLTIARKGAASFDVDLVREVIKVAGVRWRVEGDVGYIRVSEFTRHVSRRVEAAVDTIQSQAKQRIKGYVLDLRNNPGGPFDEAVFMADAFLEQGRIVSTKGRQSEAHHDAEPGDAAVGLPMVVLINGGSASAAEIVAGALRDQKRAVLLGNRSFGKGTVQRLIPLGSNDALRLTTAIYLTPSGKSVEGGIEPDMEVHSDETREGDEQLQRALETVRELSRSRS